MNFDKFGKSSKTEPMSPHAHNQIVKEKHEQEVNTNQENNI